MTSGCGKLKQRSGQHSTRFVSIKDEMWPFSERFQLSYSEFGASDDGIRYQQVCSYF
jgi:hypothetical protein